MSTPFINKRLTRIIDEDLASSSGTNTEVCDYLGGPRRPFVKSPDIITARLFSFLTESSNRLSRSPSRTFTSDGFSERSRTPLPFFNVRFTESIKDPRWDEVFSAISLLPEKGLLFNFCEYISKIEIIRSVKSVFDNWQSIKSSVSCVEDGSWRVRASDVDGLLVGVEGDFKGRIFLTFKKIIGKGKWKIVRPAIDLENLNLVAHAKVKSENISYELQMHELLKDCPYILPVLKQTKYLSKGRSVVKTNIITPLCELGMFGFTEITSKEVYIKILKDVLEGLVYMHERGIVHRDIKPQNIMLKREDAFIKAKIIDLGAAIFLDEERGSLKSRGTIQYYSPEHINGLLELSEPGEISEDVVLRTTDLKRDVWALGVTVYELFYDKFLPWMKQDKVETEDLLKSLTQEEVDRNFPPEGERCDIGDLIHRMLTVDLESRPSARECLDLVKRF